MRYVGTLLCLSLNFSVLACGAAPNKATLGTGDEVPRSQLGHYATADGRVGFTLDRTSGALRVQFDRSSDVVELFEERAFTRGDSNGHFYNGPDGRAWLYVGDNGALVFIPQDARVPELSLRDLDEVGLTVHRDGSGVRLGEPTKRGIADVGKPQTTADVAEAKLTEASVTRRFSTFKTEDSGNLAKVEEALAAATPDMIMRVTETGGAGAVWAPASPFIGLADQSYGGRVDNYPADASWDKGAQGLGKYGAELDGPVNFGEPSSLSVYVQKGWSNALAAGTPGVVWDVRSTTVVFVTLDGGRYHLALSGNIEKDGLPLQPGAGEPTSWPKPLQHALINVGSIRGLLEAGALDEKRAREVQDAAALWPACVDGIWESWRKERDRQLAVREDLVTKRGHLVGSAFAHEERVKTECEPAKKKLDAALVTFIEARSSERVAMYERTKKKLAGLSK